MKKFTKMAMAGALAGVMVIGGVTMVANANGDAYGDFKKAAMKTSEIENVTTNYDFTIKQDGEVITGGNGYSQSNEEKVYSSTTIEGNGQTLSVEMAGDEDKYTLHIGDEYYGMDEEYEDDDYHGEWRDEENTSENREKMMDAVIDMLAGDTKAYFTGGGDSVTLNLEGAQVPELLNIAVSAMMEERTEIDEELEKDLPDGMDVMHDAFNSIPTLTGASVSRINVEAKITDGYISTMNGTLVITGKDEAGVSHEIEMAFTSNISEIGTTTPATIDTTGVTVQDFPGYR